MENFQDSSIKVEYSTPIDVFCLNFMSICPVTKKNDFIVPVTKITHLSNHHFAPLWSRAKDCRRRKRKRFTVNDKRNDYKFSYLTEQQVVEEDSSV